MDDADVEKCSSLLTFLPMEEVHRLASLEGAKINDAKTILAYEVTKIVHGEEEAKKARAGAQQVLAAPQQRICRPCRLACGQKLLDVLATGKVFASKGEGRRLIAQNGLSLNDEKVQDVDYILQESDFHDGTAIVKKGRRNSSSWKRHKSKVKNI